jgi:hypothetical protein
LRTARPDRLAGRGFASDLKTAIKRLKDTTDTPLH